MQGCCLQETLRPSDVSRPLVWGFNAPEATTAGPTIITSSSSSSAAAAAATATTTTATTTTTTAAAAAAATTTTTKPTYYDSTAASPVPEVTYDAWTNYTFILRAESQHSVGQSHGQLGFPTSGVTGAATTTTAATNAKENDDGTWNSCGCGKHGQ